MKILLIPNVVKGSVCKSDPGWDANNSDKKDEPLLQDDTNTNLEATVPGSKGFLTDPLLKKLISRIFSENCLFG